MNEQRSSYHNPDSVDGGVGAFCLPFHREMVADPRRVNVMKAAIDSTCKDRIVFESGVGTGIMSIFAARAGATRVYATEIDPAIRQIAISNVARTGLTKSIKILDKGTTDVSLEDVDGNRPDVFIVENLSTWLVTEPQLVNTNYLIKTLAHPESVFLPQSIKNFVCLAETEFVFHGVEVRSHYFEFSGVAPVRSLSENHLVGEIAFRESHLLEMEETITITATADGLANSVRLTNELLLAPGICFHGCDTLLPPVVFPTAQELPVKRGQRVAVSLISQSFGDWRNFRVSLSAR